MTPHPSVLTPPPYNNNKDYKGGTHDKTIDSCTPDSDVSRNDDASVKINLDEENKNAEDDEYIDHPPVKNDKINSQSHENIRKILFLKMFSMKIFDLVLSNIVQYENEILAVDYINQKTETKEKWNQINVLDVESMLVANCHMPLLHMSKSTFVSLIQM